MPEGSSRHSANLEQWALVACRQLIQSRKDIEERLRRERRLDEFRNEMKMWRETFVCTSPFAAADSAGRLHDICTAYGLMPLMEPTPGQNPGAVRTRGALRTRGTTKSGGASASAQAQMLEVAELYALE